ncbi:hypothetical protein K438DRAFT_1765546 [Mycena galopus ATCC 62051]|nr:hypothetical protein K438DRAFT_1765546 [Mycena galopus ATCC 62051]
MNSTQVKTGSGISASKDFESRGTEREKRVHIGIVEETEEAHTLVEQPQTSSSRVSEVIKYGGVREGWSDEQNKSTRRWIQSMLQKRIEDSLAMDYNQFEKGFKEAGWMSPCADGEDDGGYDDGKRRSNHEAYIWARGQIRGTRSGQESKFEHKRGSRPVRIQSSEVRERDQDAYIVKR